LFIFYIDIRGYTLSSVYLQLVLPENIREEIIQKKIEANKQRTEFLEQDFTKT